MIPADIVTVLQTAFRRCETADNPLSHQQKQILLEAISQLMGNQMADWLDVQAMVARSENPLDELTDAQRQTLLQFIRQTDSPDCSWKVHLLNDWLQAKDSGAVQFIRDAYGLGWLERVQPAHIADYFNSEQFNLEQANLLPIQVGDRIEICNALWEWVQDDGPCDRQWFPCVVMHVNPGSPDIPSSASCIIRFEAGAEYEIQGIYDWNRYNWRWATA